MSLHEVGLRRGDRRPRGWRCQGSLENNIAWSGWVTWYMPYCYVTCARVAAVLCRIEYYCIYPAKLRYPAISKFGFSFLMGSFSFYILSPPGWRYANNSDLLVLGILGLSCQNRSQSRGLFLYRMFLYASVGFANFCNSCHGHGLLCDSSKWSQSSTAFGLLNSGAELTQNSSKCIPVWITRERSKMFAKTKDLLAHGSIAWFYAGLPSKFSEVYFQVQKFWLNSKDWKTLLSNAKGQPCDTGCKIHVACVQYTAWYDVLQYVKVI